MQTISNKIRLLLIDDHSLFRESLSRLLQAEPEFSITGSFSSSTAALRNSNLTDVDIVLLDYDLGEEQGSRFLDQAASHGFRGRVLLVTAGMSDTAIRRLVADGISGIFLKHSPPSQLVEAIRKVLAGEQWFDSRIDHPIINGDPINLSPKESRRPLTFRERTVLRGVFEGLANKEIGAQMAISESAVKAVLQQLFDKTGVRTRSQLVRIALEKHSEDWLGTA